MNGTRGFDGDEKQTRSGECEFHEGKKQLSLVLVRGDAGYCFGYDRRETKKDPEIKLDDDDGFDKVIED